MRKGETVLIYEDELFYAAFPSIVSRPDGELVVAFRRAPERRRYGAPGCTHCDPNSYLVLVRSRDLGRSWSGEPETIHAHALAGSQDPCLLQLDDGALLCSSYAWMLLPQEGIERAAASVRPGVYGWTFSFLGGYLVRSFDAGHTWEGPILPPQVADQETYFPGVAIPAMNRGAMVQGRDGRVYWAVATSPRGEPQHTRLDLLVSSTWGQEWEHISQIADGGTVDFNETSLVETPAGDLVALVRTAGYNDHGVVVRSRDQGRTWEPWQDMGVIGHPYHGLTLPDGRVFLVYGYRHEPYGIRARLLDPECTDFSGPELVLRDDGGNGDLGYPWACLTRDGRILAVYYFNRADGTRHIAGTFVDIA
jgi:hypothetical protein